MTTNPEAGMRLVSVELITRAIGFIVHDDDCNVNCAPGHGYCNCGASSVMQELRHLAAAPVAPAGTEGPIGHPVADALIAGFLHGVGRQPWDDMHDYIAVCAMDYLKGERLPERKALAARAQPPVGEDFPLAVLVATKQALYSGGAPDPELHDARIVLAALEKAGLLAASGEK